MAGLHTTYSQLYPWIPHKIILSRPVFPSRVNWIQSQFNSLNSKPPALLSYPALATKNHTQRTPYSDNSDVISQIDSVFEGVRYFKTADQTFSLLVFHFSSYFFQT